METTKKIELLKLSVASYDSEYKDLIDIWKQLEVKAQGLAVIDGVLLTGSITFATRLKPAFIADYSCLFGLLLIAVFVSIATAIWVLRTEMVYSPPYGDASKHTISPLTELDDESIIKREANMYNDLLKLWVQTTGPLRSLVIKKSKRLFFGQVCMFISLAVITLLLIIVITSSSPWL